MDFADFRSDTVTRPSPAMRQAMASAEVGDDVFGDDPTVRALEEETAALLGKEAAVFVPSGTMGNELAILAHTERGDELIAEASSHIFLYEGGGPAFLGAVQIWPLPGSQGIFTAEAFRAAVRPDDPHQPRTRLLCLENTHNHAGGRALPLDAEAVLTAEAHALGILAHLDGARLWNAAVASGRSEAEHAALFDSVSVCFSKGLGAPVGSALAGPKEFIRAARRYRKKLGGGMRQVGILAAGALHALHHNRPRLSLDHLRAKRLADGLRGLPGLEPADPETNILLVNLRAGAAEPDLWVGALAERGVLVLTFGPRQIRLVTHLDVDDAGVERALAAFRDLAGKLGG